MGLITKYRQMEDNSKKNHSSNKQDNKVLFPNNYNCRRHPNNLVFRRAWL